MTEAELLQSVLDPGESGDLRCRRCGRHAVAVIGCWSEDPPAVLDWTQP